ncbi:MAG: 2-amino-4-hydroxy-6-hydroxymethyldihydropteridine diphosphokinase [Peptococcaceae bacterium]|nr:2-amino-4-hydroxy-6-hydroxymethyldihydropteridine diphosphokinase [Peptococcaceae bacterium]
MAERVLIGIGSNVGRKEENIRRALELLAADGRLSPAGVAPLYRTDPVGYREQDWFLNTVAEYETDLSPRELLEVLMRVENEMGRRRTVRWGPRVIDLDILLYGNVTVNWPDLQIPHPRMVERAFVVAPLADLHPDMPLPGGRRAAELAAELSQAQKVERYDEK